MTQRRLKECAHRKKMEQKIIITRREKKIFNNTYLLRIKFFFFDKLTFEIMYLECWGTEREKEKRINKRNEYCKMRASYNRLKNESALEASWVLREKSREVRRSSSHCIPLRLSFSRETLLETRRVCICCIVARVSLKQTDGEYIYLYYLTKIRIYVIVSWMRDDARTREPLRLLHSSLYLVSFSSSLSFSFFSLFFSFFFLIFCLVSLLASSSTWGALDCCLVHVWYVCLCVVSIW